MARRAKSTESSDTTRKRRPAISEDARENQMIDLAVSLAEQQLRDGTASSQIIAHYLKRASRKERLEQEILEKQKELIAAKTEALHSEKRMADMYSNAIKAMRKYSGQGDDLYDEEYDESDDY